MPVSTAVCSTLRETCNVMFPDGRHFGVKLGSVHFRVGGKAL